MNHQARHKLELIRAIAEARLEGIEAAIDAIEEAAPDSSDSASDPLDAEAAEPGERDLWLDRAVVVAQILADGPLPWSEIVAALRDRKLRWAANTLNRTLQKGGPKAPTGRAWFCREADAWALTQRGRTELLKGEKDQGGTHADVP